MKRLPGDKKYSFDLDENAPVVGSIIAAGCREARPREEDVKGPPAADLFSPVLRLTFS